MGTVYFNPGCALSLYRPEAEKRILAHLNQLIGGVELHKICCRHDPKVRPGSTIVNVCAGCDRRFGNLYEGVSTVSLWEILDQTDGFPFPDHGGARMSVHDPCPVRNRPRVHAAVRSLLARMNIEVIETPLHGARSVCCGDSFYPALTAGQIEEKMRQRAASMPCQDVVVSCVSCIKAMAVGGRTPRHLVDLLYGDSTPPGDCGTAAWHERLDAYIDAH